MHQDPVTGEVWQRKLSSEDMIARRLQQLKKLNDFGTYPDQEFLDMYTANEDFKDGLIDEDEFYRRYYGERNLSKEQINRLKGKENFDGLIYLAIGIGFVLYLFLKS